MILGMLVLACSPFSSSRYCARGSKTARWSKRRAVRRYCSLPVTAYRLQSTSSIPPCSTSSTRCMCSSLKGSVHLPTQFAMPSAVSSACSLPQCVYISRWPAIIYGGYKTAPRLACLLSSDQRILLEKRSGTHSHAFSGTAQDRQPAHRPSSLNPHRRCWRTSTRRLIDSDLHKNAHALRNQVFPSRQKAEPWRADRQSGETYAPGGHWEASLGRRDWPPSVP